MFFCHMSKHKGTALLIILLDVGLYSAIVNDLPNEVQCEHHNLSCYQDFRQCPPNAVRPAINATCNANMPT